MSYLEIQLRPIQFYDFKHAQQILCHYLNETGQFQIIRIVNIPNLFFERAIPPHQSLLFETPSEAELEIYTGYVPGALLSRRLPCKSLACNKCLH
ncbi:DUF1830 domain-containing protein [Synechococcus sp. PCC 7335]|uniref:DUF1830 domain-containing protein n=1 Tax=Synechococcus sp. (strain ATCC 29403 / PCC 7335) TaxID=91464 RepID=UPI0008FEAF3A